MKISHGLLMGCLAMAIASPAFAEETNKTSEETPAAAASTEKKDAGAAVQAKSAEKAEDRTEAQVKESAEAAKEEAAEEEGKDWRVGVSVGTRIGQGTFVSVSNDTEYADPNCVDPIYQGCVGPANSAYDRVSMSYGINGSYQLKDFSFSTGLNLSHWLTPGGGMNRPHEVRLSDSGLGIGYTGWSIDSIGVNISPSLGLQFPTSKFARVATLVLGTNLGVSISKRIFDKLGLSLSVGFGKDFHSSEAPLIDAERLDKELDEEEQAALADEIRPEAVVYRGGEEVRPGLVAIGGVNTEYSLSTGLSASWAIYKKLRMSASYRISTSWTYAIDDNPDVEPQGDFIQGNRGVGQSFGTSVNLSYPVQVGDVNLGFSAGIGTGGYPKTSDNKSFKFPFWNTSGAAGNASAIRFGVSASY